MSIVYNLIILRGLLGLLHRHDQRRRAKGRRMSDSAVRTEHEAPRLQPAKVNRALAGSWISGSAFVMVLYLVFLMLPIYWLINMSFKTNTEITTTMTLWPHEPDLRQLSRRSSPIRVGMRATSTR